MKHNFSELLYCNFSVLMGQKGFNSPESVKFVTELDHMDPAAKNAFLEYRNTYLNCDIFADGITNSNR